MDFGVRVRQLGQLVQTFRESLYQPPANTISGISSSNWPSAAQPIRPFGPPGSEPLGMPIVYGQNMVYTPRPDAEYDFATLRRLSRYPLARICIENIKDMICQLPWRIELRALPGETKQETKDRRRLMGKGDPMIRRLSRFLERPDGENDWETWLRKVLEDMLTIDAATVQIRRTFNRKLAALRWLPGHTIARYVDDNGDTPKPPDQAYAQLYDGVPRVGFSTDQILYMPRNIVPGNTLSSFLYGFGPVEQVAPEIEIGVARLQSVMRYYDAGAIPEFLHIAPSKVQPKQMQDAMDWVNNELAGQLDRRRQYRVIQGFTEDGKDQIIFPKEPVLADVFDELHIRKIAFAFGTSPQRLQRMVNRGSAQTSQQAAEEEGTRPWKTWVERSLIGRFLWMVTGAGQYQLNLEMEHETDELKKVKIDQLRVAGGLRTINDINRENGETMSEDPDADVLAITTANGRIPIGKLPPQMSLVPKTGDPQSVPTKKGYVNGHATSTQ